METMAILILFAVAFIAIALFRFSFFSSEAKGERGEHRIAMSLERLDPAVYHVMNDVLIPDGIRPEGTTQIDHIVLSVYGIFVIETKNYSGWIFGDADSSKWCQTIYGKRSYFQNPYRQNYKHICCLSALTRLPRKYFVQVVAFTGNCTVKTLEKLPKSFVTTEGELCDFILSHKTEILNKDIVAHIENAIRGHLIEKTEVSLDSHVSYVRQRKNRG